jgi:GNAT superfamily N-acetyltransferase
VTPARWPDAGALVREYVTSTQIEAGGGDLPPSLVAECANLAAVYAAPGTLLLATADETPVGCVALRQHEPGVGIVKRLYVRATHRRLGIAGLLMDALHAHAAEVGFGRLVLDVRPGRPEAIAFYRGLGYTDIAPYVDAPMVCLGRLTPGGRGPRR